MGDEMPLTEARALDSVVRDEFDDGVFREVSDAFSFDWPGAVSLRPCASAGPAAAAMTTRPTTTRTAAGDAGLVAFTCLPQIPGGRVLRLLHFGVDFRLRELVAVRRFRAAE